MEIKAKSKFVRISPRKVGRVARLIRGKEIKQARTILKFLPHKGARILEKVLNSAIANAVNNYKLKENTLVVEQAYSDTAPTFKRYKPRARGRMDIILKRNAHVTVVLKAKEGK